MKTDHLNIDLETAGLTQEDRALLGRHDIKTYSALFALLRSDQAEVALRVGVCWLIISLRKQIDQRRAVPALLAALKSRQTEVRIAAARVLGLLNARRAFQPLLAIAREKQENVELRLTALNTYPSLHTKEALSALRHIIFDESDQLEVRAMALEWSFPLPLEDYLTLLSHPTADLRFWSAFRLAGMRYDGDLLPAFDALDRVAAFDHTLPEHWGWHVDREALKALEDIRFAPYRQTQPDEDGEPTEMGWETWMISAALEYDRFLYQHQAWQRGWQAGTAPPEPGTLHLSSEWLKQQIEQDWGQVSFQPQRRTLQTFTLEWVLEVYGHPLLGGLHRDGYCLVLTGHDPAVHHFAA